jgi:hypothetical protein
VVAGILPAELMPGFGLGKDTGEGCCFRDWLATVAALFATVVASNSSQQKLEPPYMSAQEASPASVSSKLKPVLTQTSQ